MHIKMWSTSIWCYIATKKTIILGNCFVNTWDKEFFVPIQALYGMDSSASIVLSKFILNEQEKS
jgi:hypothetical protein